MSDDLVDRLRDKRLKILLHDAYTGPEILDEAADEIERLTVMVEVFRATLLRIRSLPNNTPYAVAKELADFSTPTEILQ